MQKNFLIMLVVLIVSVQNFCGAATIEEARFDNHEKVIYPVVHVGDAAIDRKINTAIIAEVDRFLTGIYRTAQVNDYEVVDVRTSYEVGSNEAGGTVILSLVITESNYYKGGAHPATYKRTLNFNTATGELMGMNYLTEVGEGVSAEEFRGRIEQKLREHCAREKLYLFPDALPLKKLPENFYWDANLHVHFIFQHYEVAPYAMGIIDVDIDA